MHDEPLANKWDMCKKTKLKKSMESSTFMSSYKSIKEYEQGESKFKECKVCNTKKFFNDDETKVRRVKALVACTNFLT